MPAGACGTTYCRKPKDSGISKTETPHTGFCVWYPLFFHSGNCAYTFASSMFLDMHHLLLANLGEVVAIMTF